MGLFGKFGQGNGELYAVTRNIKELLLNIFLGFDLQTPSLHPAGWRLGMEKKSQDVDVQFGHPVAIDQLRNDKWCRH